MKRSRGPPASKPSPASGGLRCQVGASALPSLAAAFARAQPFPHIQLPAVFPQEALGEVREELLSWEASGAWTPRRNDLYSFTQSSALAQAPGAATRALAAYLYSPAFRELVEGITGVQGLAGTMDASSAMYRAGDYLLCHDDDLLTRRVAFILYLTPRAWSPARDGGALELFAACPLTGHPTHVAATLAPQYASLVLFEVTRASFHQVAEVLEDTEGPRLSISGWFHKPRGGAAGQAASGGGGGAGMPLLLHPPLFRQPLRMSHGSNSGSGAAGGGGAAASAASAASAATGTPLTVAPTAHFTSHPDTALSAFISPTYLKPSTAAAIASKLRKEGGALLLPGFLREEAYAGVMRALAIAPWRHLGPPIVQSLRRAYSSSEDLPPEGQEGGGSSSSSSSSGLQWLAGGYTKCPLRCLFALLCGTEFRALLQGFLGGGQPPVLGNVTGAVRAFAPGDYTIITDPEYLHQARVKKAQRAGIQGGAGGGEEGGVGGRGSSSASSSSSSSSGGGALLEATLMCVLTGAGEWDDSWGGVTTYLTAEEERESVSPQSNSLCIVLREEGLLSFVKHVSRMAPEPVQQIHLQYKLDA